MKLRNLAMLGTFAATVVISGDALALPVDNPGGPFSSWQVSLGAPFIDFPLGHHVDMTSQWQMSFDIPDGTTGVIKNGTFVYPTLPVSGMGSATTVTFLPDGCSPLEGKVDAGHGTYTFVFTGKLMFQTGSDTCITPVFDLKMSYNGSFPPGSHAFSSLDTSGKAQIDKISSSVMCSNASASTINAALDLGPTNSTTFYFYKAGITTIKGSY